MKIYKPSFWNKKGFISCLLYPLTWITLIVNLIKNLSYKNKFEIKTICIGNIYVGGTGKTPLAIEVNNILKKNYKTIFIKKRYFNQHDEQKLLKSHGKLVCLDNRIAAINYAQDKKFEVGIIDDGLQEKKIKHDITIACFNSSSGFGNGFLLPAGPLREHISNIKNYDAIFLNGWKKNHKLKSYFTKIKKKINIFEGHYVPTNLKKINRNKNFLIFSGLGNPDEFEKTLAKYKFKVKKKYIYPDHYEFSDSEINKLKREAKKEKLDIITTEKDYLRLTMNSKKNITYLKIKLKIKNEKIFLKFLTNKL